MIYVSIRLIIPVLRHILIFHQAFKVRQRFTEALHSRYVHTEVTTANQRRIQQSNIQDKDKKTNHSKSATPHSFHSLHFAPRSILIRIDIVIVKLWNDVA